MCRVLPPHFIGQLPWVTVFSESSLDQRWRRDDEYLHLRPEMLWWSRPKVFLRSQLACHFHCSPIVISAVTKPDDYLDRDYFPIQTSFLLKVLRCTELLFARASLESCLLSIMLSLFMDFVNGTFFYHPGRARRSFTSRTIWDIERNVLNDFFRARMSPNLKWHVLTNLLTTRPSDIDFHRITLYKDKQLGWHWKQNFKTISAHDY